MAKIIVNLVRMCCIGCLILPTTLSAGTWEFAGKSNQADVAVEGDVVDILTTGNDPFLIGSVSRINAKDAVLEFDYLCAAGVDVIQVYFGPPFGKEVGSDLRGFPGAQTWQTYSAEIVGNGAKAMRCKPELMRIDFGRKAGLKLKIRNLLLRPRTDAEIELAERRESTREEKVDEAKRISSYLKEKFPLRIDKVVVQREQIMLTGGNLPSRVSPSDLRLVEYPPWHSIGKEKSGIPLDVELKSQGDQWQVSVPRIIDNRDRLHSSWRLFFDNKKLRKYVTARHYATEIVPVTTNHPQAPLRPANQKGMGGIMKNAQLDELIDLGVTAITVNIPLTMFVAANENPEFTRLEVPGDPVFFNPRGFQAFDPVIEWASKNRVVVTAIILIPIPKNRKIPAPLVHPENAGGTYAMPDLSTDRGAIVYQNVLDRVASHYSNTESSPGGITNWIAHNEIDYHNQWTNMGPQPNEIITENYYRSMRMIYNAARQHNPHARVFTSTTHHWNVPDDGQWLRLAPRDLHVSIQKYSIAEGDFSWGVGFHPYPKNLLAALPWMDEGVSDDFDSPMITMFNTEVLIRFLDQASMLDSERKPRPVLLSEQGFHSVSYSSEDQANQAASLAYAMKKISKMPTIESFHYHRWMDHPAEKGKFGLRTLPSPKEKFGSKKLSWKVYQAISTESEQEVTKDLPAP